MLPPLRSILARGRPMVKPSSLPELTFSVKTREGRMIEISVAAPPNGEGSATLSSRRDELKRFLEEARSRPGSDDVVFVYDQLLRRLEGYLCEHGDVALSANG
jgi:hypothetical protein